MFEALKFAIYRLLQLDVPVLAGGLAFYGVLSIFPTIALALMIYSFISTPVEALFFAENVKHLLPRHAYKVIVDEFALLADWAPQHITPRIIVATALVTWSAMSGWKALISGIRLVSGERRAVSIVGYQFQSFLLSFVFIGVIVAGILVFIFLVRILNIDAVGGDLDDTIWPSSNHFRRELLIWGLAGLGIYGSLLTIYRVVVSRATASLSDCSKGAAAAAFAWFLAIAIFDYYAETASWQSIYGALTGAIAFLLWFYISAYTALFGAAFAASLTRLRKQDGSPASSS